MRFNTWAEFLEHQRRQPYMRQISEMVQHDRLLGLVYPAAENVFRFTETPLADVKVVILGQDPYHQPGQADGLAFSYVGGNQRGQVNRRIGPRSLYNIFRELQSDLGDVVKHRVDFETKEYYIDGDLTPWTRQGVLLLNTALTVRRGEPGSHLDLWQPFTDEVIRAVCDSAVVAPHFILWGREARKSFERVQGKLLAKDPRGAGAVAFGVWNSMMTRLITATYSAHPSPLSAKKGFFGSRPFSRANMALLLNNPGCAAVEWRLS